MYPSPEMLKCHTSAAHPLFYMFRFQPADIGDYEDLHAFPIKNPKSMYDWEDDEAFARLRLQGKR